MQGSGPDSSLEYCKIRRRPSVDQAQTSAGSVSEACRVCMQKKKGLCADICSSRAAERASDIFLIMIEFSHDLKIVCHNPANLTGVANI